MWQAFSLGVTKVNETQCLLLRYSYADQSKKCSKFIWLILKPEYVVLDTETSGAGKVVLAFWVCPILECKSRKSRNTWSNRQIWPWNTEWSRAKTNRVLPRKCTGHSKHPLPTTQEKTLHMDITRWSTLKSDWLYSLQPKMEKLYTVNKNKTRSWLWFRSWTPYCQLQT